MKSPVSRSGRFTKGPAEEVAAFSQSISYDWRLWEYDILGSMAHATMLESIGILTRKELKEIVDGLEEIACEIHEGKFVWKPELEDVHMNIESALTERTAAGSKLHTARSRNDQVALDVRLWVRDEIVSLSDELKELQKSLAELGEKNQEVIIPGYTHMQRAQPVLFAHHCLAYVEMFERDNQRLRDSFKRVNVCPLGNGALAGSTLPLNREMVAALLGFVDGKGNGVLTQNSLDGVSDRDFVIEFCANAALIAMHLSRLAEDLILWVSSEFNFITISDEFTTGSSLMPQKKNPDIAELTRGKTGRVYGNLMALLTLLKGLPMTYNRDLQEDKERLFDTCDTVRAAVRLNAAMLRNIRVNREHCARAASDPSLLATDLADYLVLKGVAFREAHHAVGKLVQMAESSGRTLAELKVFDFKEAHGKFEADALQLFDLKKSLGRRELIGASGYNQVKKQLARWKRQLG